MSPARNRIGHIILLLALISFISNLNAQDKFDVVDPGGFKIDTLNFISTKDEILKRFGKPAKVFEPNYECGFLSQNEQGRKYYSLQYRFLKFTGNSKEGYLLEEVSFESGFPSKVTFKNKVISNRTTVKEFERIFGVKVTGSQKMLVFNGADDAVIFTFNNGLLSKMEYWSPC